VGWKCLKKRAGEYKDEIIGPDIVDAGFVAYVTENGGAISRIVDSVALATSRRCY
jgi:hypothetical protein